MFAGGQTNLYVYVGNDPVNLIDPAGLWGFTYANSGQAGYCAYGCVPNVGGGSGFYIGSEGIGFFNFAKTGLGVGAHAGIGPEIGVYSSLEALSGGAFGAEIDAALVVGVGAGFTSSNGNWSASVGGGLGAGLWGGAQYVRSQAQRPTSWQEIASALLRDLQDWARLYPEEECSN